MTTCTYKFKDASGEEVTITGQADMKAFLANGGLEQLLPGKVLPWAEKNSLQRDSSWVIKNKKTGEIIMETFDRAKVDALNTEKYEAVPILTHLQSLNGTKSSQPPAITAETPNSDDQPSRDTFLVARYDPESNEVKSESFARGEYVRIPSVDAGAAGKVSFGDIEGVSHAKKMVKVRGVWYSFGQIYKAERPESPKTKTVPMSEALDSANKKYGGDTTEADRILTLADIDTLVAGLNDGTVSADAYKAAWQAFQKSADTIKAGLHKLTKPQLLDKVGGTLAYRMKGENKPEIVASVFKAARNTFALGRNYGPSSYVLSASGMKAHEEAKEKALADLIDATTDEDLKRYADDIAAARAERSDAMDALMESVKDPKTLDDFRTYMRVKGREGKTDAEARQELTPEQRIAYDNLLAEESRNGRAGRKDAQQTEVRAAGQTTSGEVVTTKHTKTGEDLFVVRAADRVDRDIYNQWNAAAKRLGGWYSSYRGGGAVPGFQFKSMESAQAFLKFLGGDVSEAQEVVQQRRDSFADDRSQSAVERLNEMADRMEERADASLSQERKANTERRARMAASAEASASAEKAMAKTMRNIASAISEGRAKFLDKIRQKTQIEMLASFLSVAKYNELTKRYPSYGDFERHRGEPMTAETADYATFPKYTASRSDLARLGRELELIDGAKLLGQRILKVADDATSEYLAFVKDNIYKVTPFTVNGGKPAIFASRDDAERAIARSSLRGKAMVYPVKRGQNVIVMSPQMAQEKGLWQGGSEKRFTLTDETGEELTRKVAEINARGGKASLPYQFSTTREQRAKLSAIGIETPAEFRAALREFIAMRESAEAPSKIKQLERAMVGRKNDGLDFFPTPAGVAQEMIDAAGIEEGMTVLEPSAGMGHIAEQIRDAGVDPDVAEFSSDRRELLEAKGFRVVGNDFMSITPRDFTYGDVFRDKDGVEGVMRGSGGMGSNRVGFYPLEKEDRLFEWRDRDELVGVRKSGNGSGYDRIIMNPPFSDRRDAEHVRHAFDLLKPGGRIVAIMGEGVFFGQDKKAESFREWLDSVGGSSEKLPDGTFLDPSLPVNTATNARLVVIDKPADAPAVLRDTSALRDGESIPRDQAEAFIRRFVAEFPGAPSIMLADSFSQLPKELQEDAIAQGSSARRAKGALKAGKAFVVLNNHHSMADLEATVFHEILGHTGIRKLLGPQFSQELNKLFVGLGGYSGLERIMEARGMGQQFEGYFRGIQQARASNPDAWTDALAKSILTEEVFAHIAEQKNAKQLRDRFMALVGMVRDWLRRHGFMDLASLGESDIVFMLQHAREGLRDGSGIVRDGATVGENEIVGEDGRPIAKEGSPEYEALKLLSGRLGLRERSGPTVFKDGLRDDGNQGQDAGMDDAKNVAGKQAPNPAGDVKQGGAKPRYTPRNWKEWSELPQFQSDDTSTVLFNHGHGGYIKQVEARTSGVFDGLFALNAPGMTERGPDVTAFRIPDDKMLYQRDLDYDLDSDVVSAALADVFPRKIEAGSERFDSAWSAIVEDKSDHESLGVEDDGSIREDSFMDILGYAAEDAGEASWMAQKLRGRLAEKLGYQAVQMDDENGSSWYIVPGVKSIPLPNEQSTSARPDVAVFRTDTSPRGKAADDVFLRTINTAGGRKTVRDHLADAFSNVTGESAKTLNWWQRTIGSQYGKAKSDKDFGRVYDAAHAFLDGVSAFAKEASERASGILPHLDTWRDVSAGLNVKKQWADSQDYQAIAPAIFDGTLANGTTGKVWTDEQLRDKYDLNDKQIGHYREFRAAVDFSLETLAASEMARLARASKMDVADRDMGMPDALAFYTDQLQGKIDAIQQAREDAELRHSVERENMADLLASIPNEKTRAESLRLMEERQAEEMAKLDKASKQLEDMQGSFNDKARQIRKLQSEGYAPLMRFGQYTVDVARLDDEGRPLLDEDGNPDRPFFGMFESESEARKAEKILTEEYPGYSVTRGVLSTEANQLYRGLTPETAEMFARLLGTDENEAFQAYLKQAVANRSAMKRLINRMGIEGFATDVPRVLSAFITSNARLSSGNWHFGEMSKAVEAIPKHKGDVKTDAVKLMQYVQNPVEEAAWLRGFLFFSFLGGSVASAVVNLTQTFTTTLPYLSQFGVGDVAKALPKAMALSGRMMKKGLDAVSDKDLKDALRKASDEGVVDPQEIHLLMAEAGGNGASVGLSGLAGAINKEWATPAARVTRSLTQAWGMLFGAAEKYNRHVAFIAAWDVAPEGVDRYEFAKNAVTETQFDYTKASRPNWARGAVGATLFTFKTFSINYVEFMSRLPPRERAIALGVLFLLAGMSGMPGADDLDDVVDTVAQKMGYNWNNTAARHAWLVRTLGTGGADFVERGVSSALPLDVSARLGMGNLVPGTGVLQKSNTSPVRDVQEFFGPAGSVVAGFRDVFDNAGSGKGIIDTALPLMPKMFKDLHQAVDMVQTGQYRDMKGRKVVDVDGVDAVLKGVGFQPNSVASPRRVERMLAQSAGMQRVIRQDISELWARGVAEQDAEKVASARTILREWNEKNPESKITMNPTSIAQRVRAMRLTSADRLVKATPKDMRGALAAEMAVQQ